jgi:hypothetical protein
MKWTMELGASLHYRDKDTCSIFGNLIERFHPLDGQEIIADWIRFLKSRDVDTSQYLTSEAELYQQSQRVADQRLNRVRKKVVKISLDPGQGPSVEVAWYIDLQGRAAMVLEEFSGFGDDSSCCHLVKELGSEDWDWPCFWPFSCHV